MAHLANWFERFLEPATSYLTNCINQAATIGAMNESPAVVTASESSKVWEANHILGKAAT
jgi:hypothetical protein